MRTLGFPEVAEDFLHRLVETKRAIIRPASRVVSCSQLSVACFCASFSRIFFIRVSNEFSRMILLNWVR